MLSKVPFIKILLPLIIGIVCYGIIGKAFLGIGMLLFVLSNIVLVSMAFAKDYFKFKFKFINGICQTLTIITLGFGIAWLAHFKNNPLHYSHKIKDSSKLLVTIIEPIITKKKSYKTMAQVEAVFNDGVKTKANGDILIYFTQTSAKPAIQPGQQLLLQGNYLPIKNNGNPGEFDYLAYCHRKNISYLSFIRPQNYIIAKSQYFNLRAYFAGIRLKTISIVNQYITDPKAIGIAQALLIGDKTEIDQETWDAYSRTGIVHIIAISGMHMGLIYQGILWVLLLFPFIKKRKYIAIIIALLGMWYFACVTGLPASVMRASVMFTFLAMGDILNQTRHSFNLLFASAFVLLVFNPNWIYDIGFQLSYAAVIGIMLFIPISKRWFYSENIVIQKGYELIMATTAAQLFTLPICLHYFHQFPLAFMLANLVAIPVTSLVLYLEIILLLFAWCSPIASFIGKLISFLIVFVNSCIAWLAQLQHITIFNIYICQWQMYLLLIITALGFVIILKRKVWALYIGLLSLMVYLAMQINHHLTTKQQAFFTAYHIPKKTGIDIIVGKYYQAIQSEPLDVKDVKNAPEPARVVHKAIQPKNLAQVIIDSHYQLSLINQYKILEVKANALRVPNIQAQFIILTNNTKADLSNLANSPAQIIADGSNSLWKIEKWKEEAKALHLRFHSTAESGAFKSQLNL